MGKAAALVSVGSSCWLVAEGVLVKLAGLEVRDALPDSELDADAEDLDESSSAVALRVPHFFWACLHLSWPSRLSGLLWMHCL